MPMPKGHVSAHGYATNKSFDGGYDYRTIAEKMTSSGSKMNHATARNIFISALCKIAKPIHALHGIPLSEDALKKTARYPRFQSGVEEIIGYIGKIMWR